MNNCGILLVLVFCISFGQCLYDFEGYKKLVTGYLQGLKVRPEHIPGMLPCLENDVSGRARFHECMNIIDRLDYSNLPLVAESLTKLYSVLSRPILEVDNCVEADRTYDRLFRRIYTMMGTTLTKRLMLNFISNPQQILKDIEDAVHNFAVEKYKETGIDFGEIMHIVISFASEPPSVDLDAYLKILKGFFTGLNIKGEVDSVFKCIKAVPVAIERLLVILQQLKDLDFKKLDELIELFKQVYREITRILESLKECAEAVPELKILIQKILGVELKKIIEVLLKNYVAIFTSLMRAKEAFIARHYQEFGEILGKIVYQLFLDDKIHAIE